MGQTPTTLGDRFARRDAPEAAIPGARRDHFRDKGRGGQKKAPAAFEKPETSKGDAFAGTGKQVRPEGGYYDPFRRPAQQPVKTGVFAAPAAKPAPTPEAIVTPEPAAAARPAPAPEPAMVEPRRAPLHVVAAPPRIEPRAEEPVEVKYQDVKREEAWRKRAARSSSLVLVTGSAAEAAADVKEAPPPAISEPTPPPAAEPAPRAAVVPPPKTRSGGGGGDGGKGGGGGEAAAAIARERGFSQDDFVGILLGAAVLTLLLLWLMRGGGGQQPGVENTLVGTQFAATEPAVAYAPTAQPLVDPFGDQAVDLRPTGPIPEPAPDDTQVGVAAAAPAPAPAVVPALPVADRTMRAWFCTKGSSLTTGTKAALEKELTEFKSAFVGKELVVRGYADTRGTSVYNAALGGERANVVADFLRANGLNVVDARGIGELDGLADNQNCANQRRVDVFVSGGPGETPSRTCAPEPEVESLMCH